MFTIQFYTSAPGGVPPFPSQGFDLLDGTCDDYSTKYYISMMLPIVGMVDSIVNNNPKGWDYGAYTNYIDDKLANCECLFALH